MIISHLLSSCKRFSKRFHRLPINHFKVQTLGYYGADVRKFQRRFNHCAEPYGIRAPETSIYDEGTRAAVERFQRLVLNVDTADGFVGPQTAKVLGIKLIGE